MHFGYILEIGPTGFVDRVDMGCVRDRSQGVLQGFGLSNGRTELPFIKTGRARERQVWGEDWVLSSGR